MEPNFERHPLAVVVNAIGDVVADGPVARVIQRWSARAAFTAWLGFAALVAALGYGTVATAGRSASTACLAGLALVGVVTVFVHLVRAEARRERERATFNLARRGRSRRAG